MKLPPQDVNPEIDKLLIPLLESDGEQYDNLLNALVRDYAEPLISKIIGSKMQVSAHGHYNSHRKQDTEDLKSASILKLLIQLELMRTDPVDYGITSFPSFVAKITYNECNQYFRDQYPLRHSLKKRIHYQISKRTELDLWEVGHEKYAGLIGWRNHEVKRSESPALKSLLGDASDFVLEKLAGKSPTKLPLDHVLIKLFEWLNHPLEMELLVNSISSLLGIKDQPLVDLDKKTDPNRPKTNVAEVVKQAELSFERELNKIAAMESLQMLWKEIRQLPVLQRQALLFSLRDENGSGLITQFSSCGLASQRQIAELLEMPVNEIEELWSQFPLKDAEIARMMGTKAQQVINLRKSARERLARKLKLLMEAKKD